MDARRKSHKWLQIVSIVLLVVAPNLAGAEENVPNFFYKAASQLSKNAAVLAGIAAELDNRPVQYQPCNQRADVSCAAEHLNDIGLVLLLGGELLGGSQKIDREYRQEHSQHLTVVLRKANQQISQKLEHLEQFQKNITDKRTAEHMARAIETVEKSMRLIDQSAENLALNSSSGNQQFKQSVNNPTSSFFCPLPSGT